MSDPVRDTDAPMTLVLEIKSGDGEAWGTLIAGAKEFKTGSVGFYATGKIINPKSGKSYQVGSNITLIGSKPKQ